MLNLTSLDNYLRVAMENLKSLTMVISRVLMRDVYLYKLGKLNSTSLDNYLRVAMVRMIGFQLAPPKVQ